MKFLFLLLSSTLSLAQTYQLINQELPETSYRGLAFINTHTFLVSGTHNTIGKTTDGGKTFQWLNPTVVENRDFRDVEALDPSHYITMSIDSPAYILETRDAGRTWTKSFESHEKGMFLDAISQSQDDPKLVMVLGDPIENSRPFVVVNQFKKKNPNWETVTTLFHQPLQLKTPKEAFFAASGSNLYFDKKQVLLISGGGKSHLYHYTEKETKSYDLPKGDGEFAGMNGMSYNPTLNIGYLVGGDFTKMDDSKGNFLKFQINDSKVELIPTLKHPTGYKTAAAIIDHNKVVVCGYSGVEYSADGGNTWNLLTLDSYNNCKVSPNKKTVILVGNKGKIGRIDL